MGYGENPGTFWVNIGTDEKPNWVVLGYVK
uniref:Uncharacterized protein n=1 Tax=Siphoviridae sp. ctHxr66 TaxID=2826237 RepID=A0A8S5MHS3_9CAUD|nr:MAG TPA: hypothetical protein [Siphoviridae sp. ctHxr66]DAH31821.1 MAG TPA: hypothetical protein [Caudoviricetes sp.]